MAPPTSKIEHLSRDVGADRVASALERDGAVVIDSLVDAALMDRAAQELRPYTEATAHGTDAFSGFRTRRTGGLIARSPTCRELVMNPLVLATVGEVLAGSTNFQLHLTQIITIGPGEPAQQIHRDQWAYDFFSFPSGYEVQCNTIWAMTDFTEENGATRVVPGSNHFDDGLDLSQADTVAAEMTKGSVLLYTGSLYHGGGANRSQTTRCGVNITYNRAWLRQEENQYLSTPFDVARGLPEPLLRLMGYARGAYALGYVDDLRDPLDVLRGDSGTPALGLGDLEHARDQAFGARTPSSDTGAAASKEGHRLPKP